MFRTPGQLETRGWSLPHDPMRKTMRSWRALLLQKFRQINSVKPMSGIQGRHLPVPNSGSEWAEIITLSPDITLITHGQVSIIIMVIPTIFTSIRGVAPDTLLTCSSIGCWTPRSVSMIKRVTFLVVPAIVAGT